MRNVRARRRSFLDVRRVGVGDWIILVASVMTVASLFMPWFVTSIPGHHDEWAFTYSEFASAVVIVIFLATLFLVVYPALSGDLRLAPLPFSPPLIFFTMATILILIFTFELGRYGCIECAGASSRGFGVWVALIAAAVYMIGAVIKWGSRPSARREGH